MKRKRRRRRREKRERREEGQLDFGGKQSATGLDGMFVSFALLPQVSMVYNLVSAKHHFRNKTVDRYYGH